MSLTLIIGFSLERSTASLQYWKKYSAASLVVNTQNALNMFFSDHAMPVCSSQVISWSKSARCLSPHVFRVAEPYVLRADECFVAGSIERSGLLTPNGIDGIIEILADVVTVVHEVCLNLFPDGMGKRIPHVDRD